jgi:hypothetical protein
MSSISRSEPLPKVTIFLTSGKWSATIFPTFSQAVLALLMTLVKFSHLPLSFENYFKNILKIFSSVLWRNGKISDKATSR